MYRLQKFARKHKPALATTAAIAACLILGTSVSAWQAARATQAESQANANEQRAVANEQKAVANEQKAVVNAAAAEQKEQEAIRQRDEVKALADRLATKEQQLERTLYAAHMNLAQRAWQSGETERVNQLLEQHRPQPREPDRRGFEWHYLYRLCHSELLSLPCHATISSADRSVAYSTDGKRLAIAANDSVQIVDTESNREVLSFKADVWSVVFSPDGKRVATAIRNAEDEVKTWDTQTGQELHVFKGHGKGVWGVAFSPDGKRLASVGYDKKKVIVRDSETGHEVFSIPEPEHIETATFSPDGSRLATTGGRQVKVWNAETGQHLLTLKDTLIDCVAFSPDGKRLAGAGRSTLKLWDAQSGEELRAVSKAHLGQINSVTFSRDGKRLASGSYDKTIKVWDTETGEQLLSFNGHTSPIGNVEFNNDGTRLASAGGDGTVRIWDVSAKRPTNTISVTSGRITDVSFSSGGKRVNAIIRDPIAKVYAMKFWDAQTGEELLSLQQRGGSSVMKTSPDGKYLATGFGKWDEKTQAYVSGHVTILDAQTGRELVTLTGHSWAVVDLAFSPDGSRLVTCGSNPSGFGDRDQGKPCEVKVWDVADGRELLAIKGHTSFVNSVAWSPDGKRLATLSRDNSVKVWDAQSGQELFSLPVEVTIAGCVTFSPDGKRLATTNNPGFRSHSQAGQIKLFDANTGNELMTLKGHTHFVKKILFSPDSQRIISTCGRQAESREMKIWDAESGEELLSFENTGGSGVALSADGQRLITSGYSSDAKIFDATPLQEKP